MFNFTLTTILITLVAAIHTATAAKTLTVNQNNEGVAKLAISSSRDRDRGVVMVAAAETQVLPLARGGGNVRHERSKQRHTSEKEQQHVARTVLDTFYEDEPDEEAHDDDHLNLSVIEKGKHSKKYSQNYHHNFAGIDSTKPLATDRETTNNVSNYVNNANEFFPAPSSSSSSRSSSSSKRSDVIESLFQATAATHRATPSLVAPTTTLKAVTHKIRKLHKKKIVESLRQMNIEKLQAQGGGAGGIGGAGGGGQLIKNHHRSLMEAEQLQKQAQLIPTTTTTPTTTSTTTTTKTLNDRINVKEKQQQHHPAVTDKSRHKGNGNDDDDDEAEDEKDDSTSYRTRNDYDTNESMNDGDLSGLLDEDEDNEDDEDVNEEMSDILYQNDADVDGDADDDDDDNDDIFASTMNSLLLADKYDKNISLSIFRDINNDLSVDDTLNDKSKELPQLFLMTPSKNMTNKSLKFSHFTSNTSEDLLENSFTESSYDFLLQSEDHSLPQPRQSASTSVSGISFNHHKSSNTNEDDINFIESSEDSSYTNDPSSLNSAAEILANDIENDSVMESNSIGLDVDAEDEPNRFLEGVVDAANSDEIYDWDEISRSNRRNLMRGRDVVTKFLQIVETQHSLGADCEAGTSLNLGEGVVDRYAQDRFRIEAEVAVNRANMLTRIFKMTSTAAQADINLLHASVLSMVEFDDDIFAAGNCFDWNEHPSQPGLFCPFAYRLPPPNLGAVLAKDLAMEYHYLGNTSEWFFQARKNAEKVIARNEQYLKAFHLYSNKTDERIEDDTLAVKYEDGRWSKPYYDCGGGNIWMLTYTVPFFGYENFTYHFKGTSGIDIDLRRVDIDQCPQRNILGSTKPLNIFAGTDKCKQRTTMCEAIQGLGFRRGSYKCVCRKGYYFPDTISQHKYFNGSLLEEEYEKLMLGTNSTYNIVNEYKCLPCAEGCDSCEDGSPCIAALNWPMRTSILVLACIVIGLLPPAAWFTFRYQQVKVVRAASPALLRVIALGAFFIYCTNIVMYPNPNLYTCTARIWLREIGFSLTYGALMLKTWRISVIFRVRSAKAVKITDAALLKRLGCICGAIGTCLLVRTLVSPPDVVVGRTADDLKAFLCKTDWWDYTFTSMEVVFLAWGVRLCIMVRKAPSEFNESRFISMAIYNEFLLTCFLNVSMLFLQSPANPDLLYIIFFCHTQLTITLLLALIFGSKVYIVLRSGKSHQENIGMGAKSSGAKFNFRPQVRTFANPSSVTTSTVPVAPTTSAETKLSDQEALEEIRQLSMQLQRIQEMAPPKGVAVMTISSLLDGLKTPGSMIMVTAAASQAITGSGAAVSMAGNQLTVRPPKPEALSLLSLNTELQKYQQLQVPHKMSATTTTANNNVAAIKTIPAITLPSNQVNVAKTKPNINTNTTTTTSSNMSQGITAIGMAKCEEKAINTEIVGHCIAEEDFKQQHIICQKCYERCKDRQHHNKQQHHNSTSTSSSSNSPAKLNKCQMLGSPLQEGSISFKNIKLDCMCSQSDDLDQLPEPQHLEVQSTRRITKRTAATNTPPCTTRNKRATTSTTAIAAHKEVKATSSASLPCDDISCRLTTVEQFTDAASATTTNQKPISYLSQKQICDKCKNRYKTKKQTAAAAAAAATTNKQQHRKLSRLSKKCKKLSNEKENTKETITKSSLATVTATTTTTTPLKCQACEEQTQCYSDDILFYTTTDTSEDDSDDDDDDDDLSSSFSHSKSESKLPFNIETTAATIELQCISISLGNITTTTTLSSQPESTVSKNALLDKTTQVEVPTTAAAAAATASSSSANTASQQQQQQSFSANGSSNGKAKRPDKLVLNLNDRSKFTKEVSV